MPMSFFLIDEGRVGSDYRIMKFRVEIYPKCDGITEFCLHCRSKMSELDDGYYTCFYCRHYFVETVTTNGMIIIGFWEGYYRWLMMKS